MQFFPTAARHGVQPSSFMCCPERCKKGGNCHAWSSTSLPCLPPAILLTRQAGGRGVPQLGHPLGHLYGCASPACHSYQPISAVANLTLLSPQELVLLIIMVGLQGVAGNILPLSLFSFFFPLRFPWPLLFSCSLLSFPTTTQSILICSPCLPVAASNQENCGPFVQ